MTDTKTVTTVTLDAQQADARDKAFSALERAFTRYVETCGSEADALSSFVYAFDVDTRMRALNRIVAEGSDEPGQARALHMRLGGYELSVTRNAGRADTFISGARIGLYDRNGLKFADDGYDDVTLPNWDDASLKNRIAPAVGRLQLKVAQVANTDKSREPEKKTERASGTRVSAEMEKLRADNAKTQAMLAELLAALRPQAGEGN